MTYPEIIKMQERILNRYAGVFSAMASPIPSVLLERCRNIEQAITYTFTATSNLSSVLNTASQIQQIAELYSNIDFSGIAMALKSFANAQNNLRETVMVLGNPPCQSLLDSLSNTLTDVEPYLPQEEKEKCEQVIQPKLSKESHERLTLSDALSILSLFVTIFFGIIASRPSDQLERIIAQNDIIIEQQSEIAQLKEEDEALLEVLNSLSNSINLLTDEVELLREELESSDDPSSSDSQPDPENSQQQDGNAQD